MAGMDNSGGISINNGFLFFVAALVNATSLTLALLNWINLNSHPLEVVSRYRDTQLQVGENYSYLFNLRPNICESRCLNTHFIPNNSDLIG